MNTHNKPTTDELLKASLADDTAPNPFVLNRIKHNLTQELSKKEPIMNTSLFRKPAFITTALLIAVTSAGAIAYTTGMFASEPFPGPAVSGVLPPTVSLEQPAYQSIAPSYQDITTGPATVENARIVNIIDGEEVVVVDPRNIDSLAQGMELFNGHAPIYLPETLPGGFTFDHGWFTIDPIRNPEVGGKQLFVMYTDGNELVTLEINSAYEGMMHRMYGVALGSTEPGVSRIASAHHLPSASFLLTAPPHMTYIPTNVSDDMVVEMLEAVLAYQ